MEELSCVDGTTPATADTAAPGMGPEDDKRHQTLDDAGRDGESRSVNSNVMQAGVRKVEVVSQTWTKESLYVAYLG
jgi:hypothetical protein